MTVKLLDYRGESVEVDIGDFDNVARMTMVVVSGDEVLNVIYKDYNVKIFDSCDTRRENYYDTEYEVYDFGNPGPNLLNDVKFMNRTSSYWYMFQ